VDGTQPDGGGRRAEDGTHASPVPCAGGSRGGDGGEFERRIRQAVERRIMASAEKPPKTAKA